MKKLLIIIYTFFCLNIYAQKNNISPNDTLMNKLISYINDHKWKFWFYEENQNAMKQIHLVSNSKIIASGDSLVFITKEGRKAVSLYNNISYRISREATITVDYNKILIVAPLNSDGSLSDKSKEQLVNLYKLMLPISEKYKAAKKEKQDIEIINELSLFKIKFQEQKNNQGNLEISEEQRKFIVQANLANQQKKYSLALELYQNAFQINEFSYPQGFFNSALIAAQLQNYILAIINMGKYLILDPNAEDARKAQDKIYEWELFINK